ncbi:MAG: CPBP family intramembrane metalloprotease [Deltaproteobacteria bacterium]|nr:CPBP family intramembrane metalloprotease [Nannocystaceae bacterium]
MDDGDAETEQSADTPLWAFHLRGRVDGVTSALFCFPLFLIYQIGILGGRGQNGVDLLTRSLVEVAERDLHNYFAILGVMVVLYAAMMVVLRRRGHLRPAAFVPMLLESSLYALIMGSIILFVMRRFLGVLPGLFIGEPTPLDAVVISAGAGFHEELMFRVVIMGGLAWLLTGLTGRRRAWLVALVISSLVFSLAHHVGPAGEAFTFAAFVYRALAGAFFALVYQVRGFAVAAWTHALYDLYVLGLG